MKKGSGATFFRKALGYKGYTVYDGSGYIMCDAEGATWENAKKRVERCIAKWQEQGMLLKVERDRGAPGRKESIVVDVKLPDSYPVDSTNRLVMFQWDFECDFPRYRVTIGE